MLAEQPGTRDLVAFVTRYMTCSACHHAYSADDVIVLGHNAGFWILSATCSVCHHERPITAFDSPPYRQMPQMGTVSVPPLSVEDVEDWARFLEQFTGDLNDLLDAID